MTKRDIFIFLFRWYRFLAVSFVLVVAAIVGLQYLSPQSYSARSVLVVEHNRSPNMRSDFAAGTQITETLNTEVAILKSKPVIANAVDQTRPFDQQPKPSLARALREGIRSALVNAGLSEQVSARDNWIKQLQTSLKVEATVQSNIIVVTYASDDPDWAARIINSVVSSYIDHRLEVFSPQNTVNVYRAQMDQITAQLNEHRERIEALNQAGNVDTSSERRNALLQQRALLLELILAAEEEVAGLRTRFSEGHDRVRSTLERIASHKQEIEEVDDALRTLETMESQTAQIRLNIESEEALYQAYKTRYDEERLRALVTADLVNVRVVEAAVPPPQPDHSRLFYIVIGSAGALFFLFGLCLLFEYSDRRVRRIDVAEEILGITSLGSVGRL